MSQKPASGPSWSVAPPDWGAVVDYDSWNDRWVRKDMFAVHYGGGANSAGSVNPDPVQQIEDEKAVLRSWERFHMSKTPPHRGIDYSYAIGQSGTVYRCRGWNINGAHWGSDDVDEDDISDNAESLATVFILGGDQEPTPEALVAWARLREWAQKKVGEPLPLNAYGHQEIAASGGHSTSCPGVHLMANPVRRNREVTMPTSKEWPAVLKRGDTDPTVRLVRAHLYALSYSGWKYLLSRRFTVGLERQVKRFQKEHGLTVDGVVGEETRKALFQAISLVE